MIAMLEAERRRLTNYIDELRDICRTLDASCDCTGCREAESVRCGRKLARRLGDAYEYMLGHFEDEEARMQAMMHPTDGDRASYLEHLADHARLHEAFRAAMAELTEGRIARPAQIQGAILVLQDWLDGHFRRFDLPLAH